MPNISPHKNRTKLTKHHLTIVLPSHLSYFDEIDMVRLWQMHLQVMQVLQLETLVKENGEEDPCKKKPLEVSETT
jgi:hypothetical protein